MTHIFLASKTTTSHVLCCISSTSSELQKFKSGPATLSTNPSQSILFSSVESKLKKKKTKQNNKERKSKRYNLQNFFLFNFKKLIFKNIQTDPEERERERERWLLIIQSSNLVLCIWTMVFLCWLILVNLSLSLW